MFLWFFCLFVETSLNAGEVATLQFRSLAPSSCFSFKDFLSIFDVGIFFSYWLGFSFLKCLVSLTFDLSDFIGWGSVLHQVFSVSIENLFFQLFSCLW